jgi:hypothetical protein
MARRVSVGWGLRVEPTLRRDVRGGAVRPGQAVGEPRVQRRVPLRRMRRRPLRLPRLRPRRRPGMPLPGLASYVLHGGRSIGGHRLDGDGHRSLYVISE